MPKNRPLTGKNILVTRERRQAGVLARSLAAQGAKPLVCPVIAFTPPSDWAPVDRSLARLSEYHGLLFTSANAVAFFFGRMEEKRFPFRHAQRIAASAVGPATAEALASRGVSVHSLPESFQAEGLASVLARETIQGKRFLFPRARKAREWLPDFLEERGARVDVAVVYETGKAVENEALLREVLATEKLDYLTFTSGSTVDAFVEMAGIGPAAGGWRTVPAACIGEITADAARARGLRHILTARPSTIPGLVGAIVEHAREESRKNEGLGKGRPAPSHEG